jgi:hypothetical protein
VINFATKVYHWIWWWVGGVKSIVSNVGSCRSIFVMSFYINPLPLLFKFLLPGQEDCIFFSGHLNLHAKPETGIPYREKNYNN